MWVIGSGLGVWDVSEWSRSAIVGKWFISVLGLGSTMMSHDLEGLRR